LSEGWSVRQGRPERGLLAERLVGAQPTLVLWLDTEGAADGELIAELAALPEITIVALVPPGTSVEALVDVTVEMPTDASTLGALLDLLSLRARQRRRRRVVVCDDDSARSGVLAQWLDEAGYLAYVSSDVDDARRRLDVLVPDLVVIDEDFPSALTLMNALAASGHADGHAASVLVVGAGPTPSLTDGATRHVLRPATARELLLQVRASLRGNEPPTADLLLLPGPREVQREVQSRLREAAPFAFCAIDVEGLRESVERRGFVWGHRVLSQTAEFLRRVLRERGGEGAFLGHQRDDDFVALVAPERVELFAREVGRAFARLLPVIQGDAGSEPLRLKTTVVIDSGGRFDRYASLQAMVDATRRRSTGDYIVVDST